MPPSAERAGQGDPPTEPAPSQCSIRGDNHPQGNAEPSLPGPVGEHAAQRGTRG